MSQTKSQFIRDHAIALIEEVVQSEGLKRGNSSFEALQWVKFYIRDLTKECEGCKDKETNENSSDSKPNTPQNEEGEGGQKS